MTKNIANTSWGPFTGTGTGGTYKSWEPNGVLPDNIYPLNIALSTAGRVGFYVDYSELSTTGTHKFYVCRTHGTTGAVSVSYASAGDTHTTVSGTLNWSDGDASIQTVEVAVPSKSAGDHRMYLQLSSPTGGLVLHNGANTVAHGVIDDNTIAASNAIFIDADALSNGVGTEASPYDNWYDARDDVVASTRYVYIKGMMVPDGTDSADATVTVKNLNIKASLFGGRTSESERIYIRGWPGFTGGIDGGAQTDVTGFQTDAVTENINFVTIRKLSFTDLNNSSGTTTTGKCYALRLHSAGTYETAGWTVEHANVNGVDSGANAAIAVFFIEGGLYEGFKLWRATVANAQHTAKTETLNVLEYYRMGSVSVQRCTFENTAGMIYEKEGQSSGDKAGLSARFNRFNSTLVRLSSQASIPVMSYHTIQSNVFDSPVDDFTGQPIWLEHTGTPPSLSNKQWIMGNVFDNYTFSTFGVIASEDAAAENHAVFNNIFNDIKRPWRFLNSSPLPEYSDYNVYYRVSGDEEFVTTAATYANVDALVTATDYEDNNQQGDPNLNTDYTLGAGSSAIGTGIGGSDSGAFFTGIEEIGAA